MENTMYGEYYMSGMENISGDTMLYNISASENL